MPCPKLPAGPATTVFHGEIDMPVARIHSNPVQDVRTPKPLPKALGVDDAVGFASYKKESTPRNEYEGS